MYYRERTNFWWEKVAATPDANSQRALYLEVAKSYERLAARSEQRDQPPISLIKETCHLSGRLQLHVS